MTAATSLLPLGFRGAPGRERVGTAAVCWRDTVGRWLAWWLVPLLALGVHLVLAQEGMLDAGVVERYRVRYGESAMPRLRGWEQMMLAHRGAGEREKLERANDFFNALPWEWDQEHWGKRDYWATPLEMLGTNGGDCEDFSIAKYISLVKMGVEASKLRIVYVRAPRLQVPHMVLAYYPTPDAVPLILDNLQPEIRPASERRDLIPVYSFNAAGLWASVGAGPERRLGGASRLTAWRDVSSRIEAEGLGVRF
jgi:predicted transglutaminase-like cysteine proteinase